MSAEAPGRPFKLIVFDLDGTLADTGRDIAESVNELRRYYSLPKLKLHSVVRYVGRGLKHLLARTLPAKVRRAHPDFMEECRAIYLKRCLRHTRLFPGVRATLGRLHGCRLAVATNKPSIQTERILRGLGIRALFKAVCGGDDVRRRKPHPEVLLCLMRRFRCGPFQTLVVGDSRFDMEAGRRARCRLCAVTYGFGTRRELSRWRPDFTIGRFPKLLKIARGNYSA